jgi:hypothetical protein|tara:strand:- start:352 stop:1569 length:1218 start_codon:yes stop_codon:yes gene_type:complete
MATTSSCHRVTHDPYETKDGKLEFHNIKNKLEARTKMLKGQWPGRGCEHCKSTEDAGGISDRISHLDMPGVTAPKELEQDLNAVKVTPTQLEIYFSNTCNLKCIYCNSKFSSTIDNENRIHGQFDYGFEKFDNKPLFGQPVRIYGQIKVNPNIEEDTDKLFVWLEEHIHELNKVMILGGEPFLQKESDRLMQLLERTSNPNLTLVIFSNLTVDPARVQKWLARCWTLVEQGKLKHLQVVGSLDCWGPQAEYVRNGLDLKKYVDNFEFILNKTNITPSVNSALMALTIPTLPDLLEKINSWSKTREVYWSGMKAGDAIRPYLNPTIFGKHIVPHGLGKAVKTFRTNGDKIKEAQLNNLIGIKIECENTEPSIWDQKMLKVYLKELDRRRNLDYKLLFPQIDKLFPA